VSADQDDIPPPLPVKQQCYSSSSRAGVDSQSTNNDEDDEDVTDYGPVIRSARNSSAYYGSTNSTSFFPGPTNRAASSGYGSQYSSSILGFPRQHPTSSHSDFFPLSKSSESLLNDDGPPKPPRPNSVRLHSQNSEYDNVGDGFPTVSQRVSLDDNDLQDRIEDIRNFVLSVDLQPKSKFDFCEFNTMRSSSFGNGIFSTNFPTLNYIHPSRSLTEDLALCGGGRGGGGGSGRGQLGAMTEDTVDGPMPPPFGMHRNSFQSSVMGVSAVYGGSGGQSASTVYRGQHYAAVSEMRSASGSMELTQNAPPLPPKTRNGRFNCLILITDELSKQTS